MYSYGTPHMAKQRQDDQLEHRYSSYVMIRDVALKTCQRRWMIGRSGERRSGISVVQHDMMMMMYHCCDWYGYSIQQNISSQATSADSHTSGLGRDWTQAREHVRSYRRMGQERKYFWYTLHIFFLFHPQTDLFLSIRTLQCGSTG